MNAATQIKPRLRIVLPAAIKPTAVATELFELRAALQNQKPAKQKKAAFMVRIGRVEIPIYGRGPYTIDWGKGANGRRQRTMRSSFAKAKKFAETKATELSNGEQAMLDFGPEERASYRRVQELLLPTGKSPELAAGEFAECVKLIMEAGANLSLADAIRAFLEHRPAGVTPKTIPAIVAELIQRKTADEKGAKWLRNLKQKLERFAEDFTGPLHVVTAEKIDKWLRDLKIRKRHHKKDSVAVLKSVGLRTRKNYRDAIGELVRYAQSQNYLAKTWEVLKHVEKPEVPLTDIKIYTPEQITRLLSVCKPNILPLLAITCFAGVRHEEMAAPDKPVLVRWKDIDLGKGTIRVDKRAAKIGKRRIVKMPPNLIAWLKPHAKRDGPICELSGTADALGRLGEAAGIPWVKNAPRKSFISYRVAQTDNVPLVAREAGNSPGEIDESYLDLVTEGEAKRWFNIFPPEKERIVQLCFL
jgi:integrase